jgi:hypothetical protein
MLRSPKAWRVVLGVTLPACCLALAAPPQTGRIAPPPPASPQAGADRLVPADAGILAVLDVRRTLATPLVKKYALGPLAQVLGRDDRVIRVLRAAGVDPLRDVDTITFAASGDLPRPRLLVVARGRFDLPRVHAAAADFARQNPEQFTATKEGGLTVYEIRAEKTLFAAFADATTLVLSPAKDYAVASARKAGQAPAGLNPDLRAAMARLSGRESVWLAAVVSEQMKQELKQQDPQSAGLANALESVTGGIELTDALKLALVVHTADPGAAAQLRKKIDEVLPLLTFLAAGKDQVGRLAKEAVSTVKVAVDKKGVAVTLELTEDMIQKVVNKANP